MITPEIDYEGDPSVTSWQGLATEVCKRIEQGGHFVGMSADEADVSRLEKELAAKKQGRRVGIDLDGVCYDFAASLRTYLQRVAPHGTYPEPTRWEFYEDWGFPLASFLKHCHDGVDAGVIFQHGNPFPGTRAALVALKRLGYTLHVITDRSFGTGGKSEAATRTWLDTHDLPFDSLTFSSDKTVVKTDYMIEDKLSNYDALDADGCEVYLLDRPWNQAPGDTRRRVNSLAEFVEAVA